MMRTVALRSALTLATISLGMAACGATAPQGATGVAGVAGVDGVDGLNGADGVDGVDGTGMGGGGMSVTPDDVIFSIAMTNNSGGNHVGAGAVLLDFDNDSLTEVSLKVAAMRLDLSPLVDGVDDGIDVWGGQESVVPMALRTYNSNGIDTETAIIRAGYDFLYVYFYVQWDELANSPMGASDSVKRKLWTYKEDTAIDAAARGKWVQTGNEDRVFLMFPIVTPPTSSWNTKGCDDLCHGSEMYTSPGELVDVWHYKRARTGPTDTADDKYWDEFGRHGDQGLSAYIDNFDGDEHISSDKILYQDFADPNAHAPIPVYKTDLNGDVVFDGNNEPIIDSYDAHPAPYPLWIWEAHVFDATATWEIGAQIPGVITRYPSGSRADVISVCDYVQHDPAVDANGTWTCEFRRVRQTGNGDDRQF